MSNYIKTYNDYCTYKITGQNIGPLGSSEYTESNPLIINHLHNPAEVDYLLS